MSRIAHLLPPDSPPSIELLPCPFCGGPAELMHLDGEKCFAVQCSNFEDVDFEMATCNVYTCAGPCETAAEAAQAWNMRKGISS